MDRIPKGHIMAKRLEPSNPNVLSPKQFEEEFGIPISLQNKLRLRKNIEKDGIYALPFFRVGKRILYQRESVMQWFSKLQEKETKEIQ